MATHNRVAMVVTTAATTMATMVAVEATGTITVVVVAVATSEAAHVGGEAVVAAATEVSF